MSTYADNTREFWHTLAITGDPEAGCQHLDLPHGKYGYPCIYVPQGGSAGSHPAYRVAFAVAHGLAPHEVPVRASDGSSLCIRHLCGDAACVAPAHLLHDLMRSRQAGLTTEQRREIRRRYEGGERQVALAVCFGVSQPTIHYAVHCWQDPRDWYEQYGHELL